MYTQCSKCETVFRLPAEALRAAGGQVRCGRCGEVFNALARLAEDAGAFPKGESPLELETRADAILQSVEPAAAAMPESPPAAPHAPAGAMPGPAEAMPGPAEAFPDSPAADVEIAHLEIVPAVDEELADESSLEFTLPPGELDRIFIETKPSALHLLAASVKPSPARTPAPAEPASTPASPAAASPAAASPAASSAASLAASRVAAPAARLPGLEVSDDVRRAILSGYDRHALPELPTPPRRVPFPVWMSAAVVLTLLLAYQIIQTNGAWLAGHASLLNGGSSTAAALSSYQLRQWGVTGDPGATGKLRVRASIMNAAAQLQPYPLLRVTLADRFGARIGTREFEPAEYLGKMPVRLMTPGERVDATLDILDPGNDAEGFEIDVCVRGADKKVSCSGDDGPAHAGAAPPGTAHAAAPQAK